MTDQTPELPDGDGLRGQILSVWKIVGYDKAEKFCWSLRPEQLLEAFTPPARDGAEGARDIYRSENLGPQNGEPLCDGFEDAAPPKPAPDTMQEACSIKERIERLTETLVGTDRPHDPATLHGLRKLLFIVRDLEKRVPDLAPVPPADGTTDQNSRCERCGQPMPPGEEMFRFHGYSGDCPEPKTFAAKLRGQLRRERINQTLCEPNAATPPIRGDRKAIAQIENLIKLAVSDGEYIGRHTATLEPAAIIDLREGATAERQKTARAILSLPVQSARPDHNARANAYSLEKWGVELENLSSDMVDGCYDATFEATDASQNHE